MISVTVLAKNSESILKKTLRSVSAFPEVLLYDTGSTDQTLDIAREFANVRICQGDFQGFGKAHNLATSLATHDWILSLDSDEELSPALAEEVLALRLDPAIVYRIRRHNYFNKKRIKWCGGWDPDYVVRLYHRKTTAFDEAQVHEKVLSSGLKIHTLKHPILHTPYQQIGDFLSKMQTYSSLFALQHSQVKQAGVLSALMHSWWAFLKSYVLKRGFLGGREGLVISLYNAHTTFYKYLKLSDICK